MVQVQSMFSLYPNCLTITEAVGNVSCDEFVLKLHVYLVDPINKDNNELYFSCFVQLIA